MGLDAISDYFRSYDKETFAVFACQGREPSEADIEGFERDIAGFRLPEEFRELTMSPLGGLYLDVHEEIWPRPVAYEVGPFWSFLYGMQVYGIAEGMPDWLDIRVETQRFRDDGIADLVPFIRIVGDANRWCFDADGRIVLWSHDDPDARPVEDVTFADLVLREIHELEARVDQKRQLLLEDASSDETS